MDTIKNYQELKLTLLEDFWGYNQFRSLQEEAIDALTSGKDTLILFPTGGGKSLCYQLPALLFEGMCIVVSPLLALMKDQVYQLNNKGIEAEYLSYEHNDEETDEIYSKCIEGIIKILYVSPERLTNQKFLQNVEMINISFIAVDEAHCISEWGQDFRPSYQNISKFRKEFKKVPCMALTATATKKVLQEIILKLELVQPTILQKSFIRKNLLLNTIEIADKYNFIADFLKYNPHSGIIYARTRKESEELSEFLKRKNFKNVDYYHAGLPLKEKNHKQKKWLLSERDVLISTNAFGMGIDKENVRFVIHLSPPSSIENYFQEIGRAGRDGKNSSVILLWNLQEFKNIDDIFNNQIPNKHEFLKIITKLYSIFQIGDTETSEKFHQFNIQRLKTISGCSTAKINNILHFLHHQEILFYNQNKTLSTIELKFPFEYYETLNRKDSYFIELLMRNIDGFSTHKVHFNEEKLSQKIEINKELIKEKLLELEKKGYLDYIDGALTSIKFLVPRNDREILGKWWNLFVKIQKNKLQKWEELKYFIKEKEICKMKMILAYFGEYLQEDCMHCNVCINKNDHFLSNSLSHDIISLLKQKPATLEEIFMKLSFHQKEKVRENLILLLDSGKVRMLDFKTYSV